MNLNKTIDNRPIGYRYILLRHANRGKYCIDHYIKLFNANEYWIYKITGKQREVSYEDLLEFKYSGYILFRKDIYIKENIDIWIKWFNTVVYIQYLSKPTPPFNPNKIKIRK